MKLEVFLDLRARIRGMGVDSSGLSLSSPLIFPVVADLPIPAPFQDLSQQLQLPQRPPRRARDPREPRAVGLPLSDVNLRTGKAQDLAGFLSLSDAW